MNTSNVVFVIVTAMLLATAAVSTSVSANGVLAYEKNQATTQANGCGDDYLPTNVGCQDTSSQIQGNENTVAQAAKQTFLNVEVRSPPVNCLQNEAGENYVWDLTLDQPLFLGTSGDLPAGTVLCAYNGLDSDAGDFPGQDVQVEGTGPMDSFPVAIVLPETDGSCTVSEAHASSGEPPYPVEIGDRVCVGAVF